MVFQAAYLENTGFSGRSSRGGQPVLRVDWIFVSNNPADDTNALQAYIDATADNVIPSLDAPYNIVGKVTPQLDFFCDSWAHERTAKIKGLNPSFDNTLFPWRSSQTFTPIWASVRGEDESGLSVNDPRNFARTIEWDTAERVEDATTGYFQGVRREDQTTRKDYPWDGNNQGAFNQAIHDETLPENETDDPLKRVAIKNSAGDPPDFAAQRRRSDGILTITKNFAAFDPGWLGWENQLNDKEVDLTSAYHLLSGLRFPAFTLQCRRARPVYRYANSFRYYELQTEFHYREETWIREALDEGMHPYGGPGAQKGDGTTYDSGSQGEAKGGQPMQRRAKDRDEELVMSKPVALDGSGQPVLPFDPGDGKYTAKMWFHGHRIDYKMKYEDLGLGFTDPNP